MRQYPVKRLFALLLAGSITVSAFIVPIEVTAETKPNEHCAIVVEEKCVDIDYRNQDINHYDPTVCGEGGIGGDNKDYAGNQVLTQAQLDMIKKNQATYEAAAKEASIPWQMVAVIHLRETNLSRVNPSNGQGLYQDYAKSNGPYPAGEVDDAEFLRQSTWAANFLKGKATQPALLTNGDKGQVKDAFFGYNGRAEVYKKQATSLGFADAYEGSPYVMNRADALRDPDVHATDRTWGQIKSDGGSIEYPANSDYGAFVVYTAIKGGIGGTECEGLNGPLREKIVKLAEDELAKWESGTMTTGFRADNPNSYSKYTYNISADWCAWFASWILKEAGNPIDYGGRPYWSYVDDFMTKGPPEKGFILHSKGDGYKPQPGDFAIYNSGSHINVVVGYTDSGQMITIGGNQGAGPNGNYNSSRVSRSIGYGDSATHYIQVD